MNENYDQFIPRKHTFNLSKKLTADSMMTYSIDGVNVFRKVSHVINHDPLYVWDKLYSSGSELSLAKCAHNKLMQVMQIKYSELYLEKEKRKIHKKNSSIK